MSKTNIPNYFEKLEFKDQKPKVFGKELEVELYWDPKMFHYCVVVNFKLENLLQERFVIAFEENEIVPFLKEMSLSIERTLSELAQGAMVLYFEEQIKYEQERLKIAKLEQKTIQWLIDNYNKR